MDFGARLDEASATAVVRKARGEGVTLFDTGDNYSDGRSEEILGRALRGERAEVVVSTKFTGGDRPFRADGSRSHVIEACEGSLRRLGVDVIDLYTMQHPAPDTPIEETLEALDELVRQGKVRHLGSSNFMGWQVAEADHTAKVAGIPRFIACQQEWNLLKRHIEDEIVPACRHYDVGLMPFYPIASGMLTGKYDRKHDYPAGSRFADVDFYARTASDANFRNVERLTEFAEARGHTLLELAMSWLAGQPGVSSVLVGASRPDQLAQNIASIGWDIGTEDRTAIDRLLAEELDPGQQPFNKLA